MKHSRFLSILVFLLSVTQLVAGRALYKQLHGGSSVLTLVLQDEEKNSSPIYASDTKATSTSPVLHTNIIPARLPISSSLNKRDIAIDGDTILPPSITPVTSIAGVFLMISGSFLALIGTKNQRMQVFLSTTFLAGLGIAILVLHLAAPPISMAIQGAYLVAVLVPALVLGSLALIFKNFLEGVGSATGGFCLAMFVMTLRDGGLLTSMAPKIIFIACFTMGVYATNFLRHIHSYVLVVSTSLTGASAFMLGVDCFSRAGMKEFWVYIWGINDSLFPSSQNTYMITQGMIVEIAGIAIFAILGVVSQMKLWKVVMQQRRHHNQARRLEEQQQEDTESEHTRVAHSYDKKETGRYCSNDKVMSRMETKNDSTVSVASDLDSVTTEAVLLAASKTYDLDDTIMPLGSTELVVMRTLDTVRADSNSTTLANSFESLAEPLPDFGKISVISQTEQTTRRQRSKRSAAASLEKQSGLRSSQLQPSETFMNTVSAKLRRLSRIISISDRTNIKNVNRQDDTAYLHASHQGLELDHLSIDEAQISKPLIEQESAEQFVSSFLGNSPIFAKLDRPVISIMKQHVDDFEYDLVNKIGDVAKDTDRPPTRHGPVIATSAASRSEDIESQVQPLLRLQRLDATVGGQDKNLNDYTMALVDTGPIVAAGLPKHDLCHSTEQAQQSQETVKCASSRSTEQFKSNAQGKSKSSSPYVSADPDLPLMAGHTLQSSALQTSLAVASVSHKIKTSHVDSLESSATRAVTSTHGSHPTTEKATFAVTTKPSSTRPNLRSPFGSWPQHNNTKHSLQRRLETSLRYSKSCVLNSPIDENAVASFTFSSSTDDADILRRASYPYHSKASLSLGYSLEYPLGRNSAKSARLHPSLNRGLGKTVTSTRRRHSSDGTTSGHQSQAYLEKSRAASRAQGQRQPRQNASPFDGKAEQCPVPQHTLHRASMLAEWRRSHPMQLRRPNETLANPTSKYLQNPSPDIEASTPIWMNDTSTSHYHRPPNSKHRGMVESTIYSSNRRIPSSNSHGPRFNAKIVSKRASQLSSREVYIHREVLRCMRTGTFPIFEASNMF